MYFEKLISVLASTDEKRAWDVRPLLWDQPEGPTQISAKGAPEELKLRWRWVFNQKHFSQPLSLNQLNFFRFGRQLNSISVGYLA